MHIVPLALLRARCFSSTHRGILHAALVVFAVVTACLATSASAGELRLLHTIETRDQIDAEGAVGVAFPPGAGTLLQQGDDGPELALIADGQTLTTIALDDAVNLTFDPGHSRGRLVIYDSDLREIVVISVDASGRPRPRSTRSWDASALDVANPAGIALDPWSGHLFVLDAERGRIVRLAAGGSLDPAAGTITDRPLPPGIPNPHGLVVHPDTGHLFVWSASNRELSELQTDGQVTAVHSMDALGGDPLMALAFAPSSDETDDEGETSLYVATAGAVTEWSSAPVAALSALSTASAEAVPEATLVRTIHTSQFSPPSPDSSGLTYLSSEDRILVSDSEVNEMSIYQGVNLFEMTRTGGLQATADTTDFSDEPTGVAYDAAGNRVFISDDNGDDVYEVDLGGDGRIGTSDDSVDEHGTSQWGSSDPEGVAFAHGILYIGDGKNAEVVKVHPGSDGDFGTSDDQVSHFDTKAHGIDDAEGITVDAVNGHVYVSGEPDELVGQFTLSGGFVRLLDISEVNAKKAAGLAWAPSTLGGGQMALYVSDRGTDNGKNPDENDGRVFEFVFGTVVEPGNEPPSVDAGPDRSITLGQAALLDGDVQDDGLPESPGSTTSLWTVRSGPGTAEIADASSVVTTVTFSEAGTYVLRLTGDDGELQAFDEMSVSVASVSGGNVLDVRVARGSDDAEERNSRRRAALGRGLLAVGDRLVGVRFDALQIPQGATIQSAYVQFRAAASGSSSSEVWITVEATDDAPTFVRAVGNISNRTTTGTVIPWTPPAWSGGDEGPAQRTPDLSTLVQEVVSLGGWQEGNAMVFIIDGDGKRRAESYNGNAAAAPLLHVEWE